MKQLVIATHNRHKSAEFQSLLGNLGVEVLTLEGFPGIGPIAEDAGTLEGNALLKAHAVFQATGLPSLADDTGLEVHYLNEAPGVHSSRYAGIGVSYEENVKKLLKDLRGVPPRRRGARFRAVLTFLAPGTNPRTAEGICRGVIIEEPSGIGGFGYDPIFLPNGQQQTFAEMDPELKNRLSHRGRAITGILPYLSHYFRNG
jgi:XTP/dITP diphosphohydrolase